MLRKYLFGCSDPLEERKISMNFISRAISSVKHSHPNMMNEEFNDAFETYFSKTSYLRPLYLAMTVSFLLGFRLRKRLFGGKTFVNERIVEYPQILQWIQKKSTILDIGCVSSRLPIQLASMGHVVHGLDVRPYPFRHPNFCFHQEDMFKWEPPVSFDTVIVLSVLEHMGLGDYGDLKVPDADSLAVNRISEWLSPGGSLLVSVPFGKSSVTRKHRIYSLEQLQNLFASFKWKDSKYFARVDGHWMPGSAEELSDVESSSLPVNGVVLLYLEKRK